MLARRVATFIMGIWLGCSVMFGILMLQTVGASSRMATILTEDSSDSLEGVSRTQLEGILQSQISDQNRKLLRNWGNAQIVLGLTLIVSLVLATHRRILPLVLCALLLVLVGTQLFLLVPDMIAAADAQAFRPERIVQPAGAVVVSIQQMFGGLEVLKFLIGGLLTSYLFVTSAGTRVKTRHSSRRPDREAGLSRVDQ